MIEPRNARCSRCDALIWEKASHRCGYHETALLCGMCWNSHKIQHEHLEPIVYCWDEAPLPLTYDCGLARWG